jgi:hypothetical protein
MKDLTGYSEFYQIDRPISDLSELNNAEMKPLKAAWNLFQSSFPGYDKTNLYDKETNRVYFYVTGHYKDYSCN